MNSDGKRSLCRQQQQQQHIFIIVVMLGRCHVLAMQLVYGRKEMHTEFCWEISVVWTVKGNWKCHYIL